ncbi:MAG: type II toxin-antitoxin system RelE/ParE family toxin [Lachnospiraceae bacterium]
MAHSRYYKVVVSDKTKQMLGMHIRFMVNVSKEAAREKKKELVSAIHSLAEYPERYPYLEEAYIPSNKYHKMFVKEWYLVLYQIKDDAVYVDYIIDCRKDYDWLL